MLLPLSNLVKGMLLFTILLALPLIIIYGASCVRKQADSRHVRRQKMYMRAAARSDWYRSILACLCLLAARKVVAPCSIGMLVALGVRGLVEVLAGLGRV